jgi:hypothetical protein
MVVVICPSVVSARTFKKALKNQQLTTTITDIVLEICIIGVPLIAAWVAT